MCVFPMLIYCFSLKSCSGTWVRPACSLDRPPPRRTIGARVVELVLVTLSFDVTVNKTKSYVIITIEKLRNL